jgi:hypothetical protein
LSPFLWLALKPFFRKLFGIAYYPGRTESFLILKNGITFFAKIKMDEIGF